MGLSCCVPGCSHKNGRELCSLYNFPNENDGPDWKEWHELWCERIGKSQREGAGQSWHPTTWSRVCSCHFKEDERWKPRTRQPGLKFRAPVYFPFSNSSSASPPKSEPTNKTPLLAGLRVDTGMKSSLLAGLNVKIVATEKGEVPTTGTYPTNGTQCDDVEPRREATKRESTSLAETTRKKSKLESEKEGNEEEQEEEEGDDVEMIEDGLAEEKLQTKPDAVAAKATALVKTTQDKDGKQAPEEKEKQKKEKKAGVRKGDGRWQDVFKPSNERLLKALTQPNSPALQILHTTSASNSPVNMSGHSAGASGGPASSAYSSLVQLNAKSQIPSNTVVPMANRTVAPQSKYAELLAVIEDMGRDIRPTYSGSRTATERLKRGIVHARALVRECLAETERSARS